MLTATKHTGSCHQKESHQTNIAVVVNMLSSFYSDEAHFWFEVVSSELLSLPWLSGLYDASHKSTWLRYAPAVVMRYQLWNKFKMFFEVLVLQKTASFEIISESPWRNWRSTGKIVLSAINIVTKLTYLLIDGPAHEFKEKEGFIWIHVVMTVLLPRQPKA